MTTTLLDATRTCGISGDRWHREQPAGPAHKLLLRVVLRLRFRVRTIKEKSYDRLEDFLADVHSAVDAIGRLNPIHFANSDFPQLSFSTIAELDVGVRDLAIEEAVNRDGQVHGGGRPDGGKSGRADDFGGALALLAHGAHRTDPRPGRTQRRLFAGGGSGDSLQQFARGRLENCGPAG